MIKKLKKAVKCSKPYTWELPGPHLMYAAKFGGRYFALIDFKNKTRAVVLDNKWPNPSFHSNSIISPSEARLLIGWLARYLAVTDPDPISLAIASTKAHAKSVEREQNKIAKELGL